jgi:hypothetical protein
MHDYKDPLSVSGSESNTESICQTITTIKHEWPSQIRHPWMTEF